METRIATCPKCGEVQSATCPNGKCENLVVVCRKCNHIFVVKE